MKFNIYRLTSNSLSFSLQNLVENTSLDVLTHWTTYAPGLVRLLAGSLPRGVAPWGVHASSYQAAGVFQTQRVRFNVPQNKTPSLTSYNVMH